MKLYHGTHRKNLSSILKHGLKRKQKNGYWGAIGDGTYIYATKDIEIAKKYGDVVLEIEAEGLDLRVWDKEKSDGQIMIMGDISKDRIKIIC